MDGKELVMYIVSNDLFNATVMVEVTVNVETEAGTDREIFTSNIDGVEAQYRDKTVTLACEGDVDVT